MKTTFCSILLGLATGFLLAGDIHGRVAAEGQNDSADAVVYLAKGSGKAFPPPKEHATINQSNRIFQPKVLTVLVGTTVDFLNADPGSSRNMRMP